MILLSSWNNDMKRPLVHHPGNPSKLRVSAIALGWCFAEMTLTCFQRMEDPTCGTVFRYFYSDPETNGLSLLELAGKTSGNTSFPILFVGNKLDPITPLTGAQAMKERFYGSALLVQDTVGVCVRIVQCSMSLTDTLLAYVILRYKPMYLRHSS